jgi:hypothetical protein
MKLGIVLPSYLYNEQRQRLADDAFLSLSRSETLQEETKLLLLVKGPPSKYVQYVEALREKFGVVLKTDEGLRGTEQTLAFGTQFLFDSYDIDYVTWMGDDALFNPYWLWKLKELIERRPAAKSWSVYRSAFEWIHKTLEENGEDVRVRSICGHGMTLSRQEWKEWGIDWRQGEWQAPDGDTLDLLHVTHRPGVRWVTKNSYVQHTSPHAGTHCTKDTPEYANSFVTGEKG